MKRILQDLPELLRFEVVSCPGLRPDQVTETVRSRAAAAHRSGDLFLFFYLGHGVLSADLRLELVHPSASGFSTLPLARIERTVAAEDVKKSLFIIDCCYAGAYARSFPSELADQHCRLASTTPAAYAYKVTGRTDDPLGVFSRAILDGFTSRGACPNPADDSITADGLFNYARERTVRETGEVQQPAKIGHIAEILARYRARPDLVEGVAPADDKTAYKKLLAICRTLANFRRPPSMESLYEALLRRHRAAFETLYKKEDGDFKYGPVKQRVIWKYIRFLRKLGLVDPSQLALTRDGTRLAMSWERRYSAILLTGVERYLRDNGLDRSEIEGALRQILTTRQVPSRTTVLDYLALRYPALPREEMGIVLDALGYIGAVRMSLRRAYFPWPAERGA